MNLADRYGFKGEVYTGQGLGQISGSVIQTLESRDLGGDPLHGRLGRGIRLPEQGNLHKSEAPSPLLARGGRDIRKDIAKLPLMERTGWWATSLNFRSEPPPRLRLVLTRLFLTAAATPPGQEGHRPNAFQQL